jgi:CDP-diacylglycerol--serine O-phosphatidyltransferase
VSFPQTPNGRSLPGFLRRRPRHLRRGLPILPSLFTVGNLFLGYLAIGEVVRGPLHFENAALFILGAALLDALDGLVARATGSETPFGFQLDSLADLISFGTAPAILIYSWELASLPRLGGALAFVYLVCGAVRLARFNTQAGSVDRRWFVGLPIPLPAITVASLVWCWPEGLPLSWMTMPVAGLVGILGFLMISAFRYRSLKGVDLRRSRPRVIVVLAALVLAVLFLDPPRFLLLGSLLYALSGPALRLWGRRVRPGAEGTPEPPLQPEPPAPQGGP